MAKGKRYNDATKRYDRDHEHSAEEAVSLVTTLATAGFDETVELSVRLGVDPRKADQMVRGSVSLPHGTGNEVRVAVFAEGAQATAAEEAGADIVGSDTIIEMIEAGNLDFDAVIATPDQMGKIGRYGKVLGPRGLMPNPKSGTVTTDVATAVREVKAGKIEYRTDRQGNVHLIVGKGSFEPRALVENYAAVLEELVRQRPAAAKGRYLQSITVSATQGPGITVDPQRTRHLWEDDDS
jgi:large subunit ribosomal protein L1